jgi:hypothetical protein
LFVEPKWHHAAAKPEVRSRILGTERNGERGYSKHYFLFGMFSLTGFLGPLYRRQDT